MITRNEELERLQCKEIYGRLPARCTFVISEHDVTTKYTTAN